MTLFCPDNAGDSKIKVRVKDCDTADFYIVKCYVEFVIVVFIATENPFSRLCKLGDVLM